MAQAIVMMKTAGVTSNANIGFVMTYSFSVSYQWLIAKLWYHQFIETGDTAVMQYAIHIYSLFSRALFTCDYLLVFPCVVGMSGPVPLN